MSQYGPTQQPPSAAYVQGLDRLMARLDRLEARLVDTDRRARTLAHPPQHEQVQPRRSPPASSWDRPLPRIQPDSRPWRGAFVGQCRDFGRPSHHASAEDHHLRPRQPPPLSSWDRPIFRHYSDVEDTDVWQQRTSWDPPHHRRPSEPATCWDLPTANFQYARGDFSRQQTVGNRFPMMRDQEGRRSRTDEVELPRSNYRIRMAECRPQQPSSWDRPVVRYSTDVKAELLEAEAELPVAEVELPEAEAELPYAEADVELPYAKADVELPYAEADAELPYAEAELHAADEPHALKAKLHAEDTECYVEIVAEVLTRADQPRIVAEVLPRGLIVEPSTFVSSAPVVLQKLPIIVHAGCGVGGSSKFQPSRALVACKNETNNQSQSDWLGSMESLWFHLHNSRRVFDPGGDISPPFLLHFTSPRCSWFVATWYPP